MGTRNYFLTYSLTKNGIWLKMFMKKSTITIAHRNLFIKTIPCQLKYSFKNLNALHIYLASREGIKIYKGY